MQKKLTLQERANQAPIPTRRARIYLSNEELAAVKILFARGATARTIRNFLETEAGKNMSLVNVQQTLWRHGLRRRAQ